MTKTVASIAVAALLGAGAAATAVKLISSSPASVVAQSEHTWLTGRTTDAGPEYANQSCGRVLNADAGIASEPCSSDGQVLTAKEAACARAYFDCVVLPRVKTKVAP